MRFTQKIKYNLKRALPLLTIAGAGLMASCDKDDEPSVPQHDVEIHFAKWTMTTDLAPNIIEKHIDDKSVRNIYLVADGAWGVEAGNITQIRKRLLQPIIEQSSNIHGRGDIPFTVGEASKVPEDSLWYIQQGLTINKHLQNQK